MGLGASGGGYCASCSHAVAGALAHWRAAFLNYYADRFLAPEEEEALRALQHQLQLSDADMGPVMPELMRAKLLSSVLAGKAPPIPTPGIFLDQGEYAYWCTDGVWHTTINLPEWVPGYRGRRGYNRDVPHPHQSPTRFLFTNLRLRCTTPTGMIPIDWILVSGYDYQQGGVRLDTSIERFHFAVHDAELFAAFVQGLRTAATTG